MFHEPYYGAESPDRCHPPMYFINLGQVGRRRVAGRHRRCNGRRPVIFLSIHGHHL